MIRRPPGPTLFPSTTLFRSRHGTTFVARRDDDRARPLREREQVAPGAVIEPIEVAPDDHGVRTARWRGRGRSEEHTPELPSRPQLVCRLQLPDQEIEAHRRP